MSSLTEIASQLDADLQPSLAVPDVRMELLEAQPIVTGGIAEAGGVLLEGPIPEVLLCASSSKNAMNVTKTTGAEASQVSSQVGARRRLI